MTTRRKTGFKETLLLTALLLFAGCRTAAPAADAARNEKIPVKVEANKTQPATAVKTGTVPRKAPNGKEPSAVLPRRTAASRLCLVMCGIGTIDEVLHTEKFLSSLGRLDLNCERQIGPQPGTAEGWPQRVIRMKGERLRRWKEFLDQFRPRDFCQRDRRDKVVVSNCLQIHMMPYARQIILIGRYDADLQRIERATGIKEPEELAASVMFLTVILGDREEASTTVQVGNTFVKKTVCTRKAVAYVRNYRGEVVFACTAKASASDRKTSAVRRTSRDPASGLPEDLMKQIAGKIGSYFVCTVTCKIKGPEGNPAFDPEEVVLYLDGREFENGGRTLAGSHILEAVCDGYKPIRRDVTVDPGTNRTVVLVFRKKINK